MNQGIGKVIVAYAFLEWRVTVLVFTLMVIDHPEGRVAFRNQSAFERFKLVKSLLALRGIQYENSNDLGAEIEESTTLRNQLAHGIWSLRDEKINLRLTKESFETDEGQINRAFMPQMAILPDDYFEQAVSFIKHTTRGVNALQEHVEAAMLRLLQKRGLRDAF
jgi:hypothetical protein